ncbi:Rieske 2Fe-2S domain-containing protein [Acidisoma cellulosilytica]|uniref:nitric oxide dioxygenase n=1 Tax=Acidisoma cellulosilyticum TaxID=2802395 RepID=A0A963Z2U8_9PROT|nr:SRPBCC family protein [Acidisoma cellulosilyticum]MCB8881469.1 Rieske 2Fe-2S domain-containing protein [Acidisoma cellulosilyticum]
MTIQAENYQALLSAVEHGDGLPTAWYTDPAVTEREITDIFRRTWQYIGPASALANNGDYITGMVGLVPVAVIRNADGLAGVVNVCRHRRHQVLKGRGNTSKIQCGYHAWVYDLHGNLKGAPRSDDEPDFRLEDYPLLPIRAEAIGPFVFVNLDRDAKPAHVYHGRVLDLIAQSGIDLDKLELYSRTEWVSQSNWKTLLENYLECYHCAIAHPGFSAAIDVKPENYALTHDEWFSSQIGYVRDSALEAKSQIKTYDARGDVGQAQYHLLWPNLTININPGFPNMSVDVWMPNGPNSTNGASEQYFAPGVAEDFAKDLIEFNQQVAREDDDLTDSVQYGLRSGLPEKARFLPHAEALPLHFQRLVVQALIANPAPVAAVATPNTYHRYEVFKVERESDTITSFYLRRSDAGPVAAVPGQFLPIRLTLPGQSRPILRTYTISDVTDGSQFRLSIKRCEGEKSVSAYLHDKADPGFQVEAMTPRGKFTLAAGNERPVALVSAGVGITPMIAMLNQLVIEAERVGGARRVHFIHGAHHGKAHAFGAHVRALAAKHSWLSVHIIYGAAAAEDRLGETHDSEGRMTAARLAELLPISEADIYLCGPTGFMQSLYDGLTASGASPASIRYESFGGALKLKPTLLPDSTQTAPVTVTFARSGISGEWSPAQGTLLEFAETLGLAPAFSCRSGICGTCSTQLREGRVVQEEDTVAEAEDGAVLLCCSVPAADQAKGIVLDL